MSRTKVKIFDNEAVELLAVLFKRNKSVETFSKLAELTDPLIQSILKSEQFQDWQDVYNFLFLQMERWIERWVPGKGHLYAYISASTKNAAVSYTSKAAAYRQKVMGTDIPLEELGGVYETTLDSHRSTLMKTIKKELLNIETRWHEVEVRAALRYCFATILEGKCRTSPDKARVINYLTMVDVTRPDGSMYTLTRDQSRHLLDYAQGAVRSVFLRAKVRGVSLTESDIYRIKHRFAKFSDIEDVIGAKAASALITHFAGQTIKFPSIKVCADTKRQVASFNAAVTHNDDDDTESLLTVASDVTLVRNLLTGERLEQSQLFSEDDVDIVDYSLLAHGDGE